MGSATIGFIIHGENTDDAQNRPIRPDIKKHYKGYPCITCGTSHSICDHKNDLYNDKRVLESSTQRLDDFQPICNNCNLRKRAVSIKTVKNTQRQPPPMAILVACGGIEFTSGDKTFDPDDPKAMVGTYWYDPIAFVKECRRINSQNSYNYYSH